MGKSKTSPLTKTVGNIVGVGGMFMGINEAKTVQDLQGISDKDMAEIIRRLDDVKLPSDLDVADKVNRFHPDIIYDTDNYAQKFYYAVGLNAKPEVLDDKEFSQYMKDNALSKGQILTRNVRDGAKSASEINDITKYGDYTYVGGRYGGNAEGMGIYFAKTGGDSTWVDPFFGTSTKYDPKKSKTMLAVLDKSKVKAISADSKLYEAWRKYAKTHPETNKALNDVLGVGTYTKSINGKTHFGDNVASSATIKAVLMGYNVLTNGSHSYSEKEASPSAYFNVLDRSILKIRKDDKRK